MSDGPGWRDVAKISAVVPIALQDYDPSEQLRDNMFQDTLLTYSVFAESTKVQATIEADPLGDVNKIVRLWRLNHDGTRTQLAATLHRCRVGAQLKVGRGYPANRRRDDGTLGWFGFHMFDQVWYVEVDGRRVIEVSHFDAIEPYPPPPRPPLRRRVRAAINRRARGLADAIARPFGYHHENDCPRDDW